MKNNSYPYSKYCEFIVGEKIAEYNQVFSVSLKYDMKGIEECGMEPYTYTKRYKIPSEKEIKKYFIRKHRIQKIINLLAARTKELSKDMCQK